MICIFKWTTCLLAMVSIGCQRDKIDLSWWEGERERVELSKRLELANYRFEHLGGKESTELLADIEQIQASLQEPLEALRQRKVQLIGDLAELEEARPAFRRRWLSQYRQQLIGMKFPELELVGHGDYNDASVAAISDSGVVIRHRDGSARLAWGDLSVEQRELFGLEESTALAAEEKERQQVLAYELSLERQISLQQKVQLERAAVQAAEERRSAADRRSAALASIDRSKDVASSRTLAQPARPVGNRSSVTYSSYRRYRPTYYYDSAPIYRSNYTSLNPSLSAFQIRQASLRAVTPCYPSSYQSLNP